MPVEKEHNELPSQITLNLWNFCGEFICKTNSLLLTEFARVKSCTWSTAMTNHIIQLASRDLARRQLTRDTPPF